MRDLTNFEVAQVYGAGGSGPQCGCGGKGSTKKHSTKKHSTKKHSTKKHSTKKRGSNCR